MESHVFENKTDHVFILPNGVKFEFYAPDDEEKAKSGKRDLLFLNEANSIPYSIANQLMMRTNGPVIMDWNPSGQFWFHRILRKALKSSEYVFTRTTYKDNTAVSEKIIKELERLKYTDEALYTIYALGLEGKGLEIIYPNYEIVDSFPENARRVGRGLDFGFTNHPSAASRTAYYDGGLYFDELFYEKGLSNKAIAERFKAHPDALTMDQRGDIIADSAEPKSIAELQGYGLPIRGAVKGQDSIDFGIQQIKKYPLFVTKNSIHLIDEIDLING
jgi:phage terminase large subunit